MPPGRRSPNVFPMMANDQIDAFEVQIPRLPKGRGIRPASGRYADRGMCSARVQKTGRHPVGFHYACCSRAEAYYIASLAHRVLRPDFYLRWGYWNDPDLVITGRVYDRRGIVVFAAFGHPDDPEGTLVVADADLRDEVRGDAWFFRRGQVAPMGLVRPTP